MVKKHIFTAAVFLFVGALSFAAAPSIQVTPELPRRISIGTTPYLEMVKEGKVNFEIVIPRDVAPSVKFASSEIRTLLGKALGVKLKSKYNPSGKRPAIIIGSPSYAAKLGIDVMKLDRDGFIIRTLPQKAGVIIIGRDDPKTGAHVLQSEHATLFGVYDFLERFAGMRFYMPGDFGTIIPPLKNWTLPAIDIYDRPDFSERRYSTASKIPGSQGTKNYKHLNRLRHRYQTRRLGGPHGLREMGYGNRFGKSHPEYFARKSNGQRAIDMNYSGTQGWDNSHLCFASGIVDEIAADVISYLKGEPASVRGIIDRRTRKPGWFTTTFPPGGFLFSLTPNDGIIRCTCSRCAPDLLKGTPQQQTDHMWRFYRKVAQKVKDAGVKGYIGLGCHYSYWTEIPSFQLPDNILLTFATRGPWSETDEKHQRDALTKLKIWNSKVNAKLKLWTYPGKYHGEFPGIPTSTPHYASSFLKKVKPYIFGCYFESYTDYLFFNHLDFYIYGKILWDPDTDVDKLIDEYARLMYGDAAPQVKEFFNAIERNWMKIAAHSINTNLGPQTVYPSEMKVWNTIYTEEEVKRISARFDEGEKRTARTPEFLNKLKILRKEMWQPLLETRSTYTSVAQAVERWNAFMAETPKAPVIDGKADEEVWQKAEVLTLIAAYGRPIKVRNTVRTLRDKDNFYFAFECENTEPLDTGKREHDSRDLWKDTGVEIYLSPDRSRKRCYQIMINASGSTADLINNERIRDWTWNSGVEAKTVITPGKGWTAEIRIPRSSMVKADPSGMVANFTRRYLAAGQKPQSYVWGPYLRFKNDDLIRFGTLSFHSEAEKDLVKDGSFNGGINPKQKKRFGEWYWNGAGDFPVTREYLAKGKYSAVLDSKYFKEKEKSCIIRQNVALKPDTEYELSFAMKLENVKNFDPKYSGFYVRIDDAARHCKFPHKVAECFTGTMPWTPAVFRFRTSKEVVPGRTPRISFVLGRASGKVWIDDIRLFEVKK